MSSGILFSSSEAQTVISAPSLNTLPEITSGFNFRVLNRRGQTVFYSEDPTAGWDGNFEGKPAPIGVYVYRLNYQGYDSDGVKIKKKMLGTVTLIR